MSGLERILAKGGPAVWTLCVAYLVWLLAVLGVVFLQRSRLGRRLRAVQPGEDPEAAVSAVRDEAGALASGRIGTLVVASWWVLALVLLLGAIRASVSFGDLVDEDFYAAMEASGQTASQLARSISAGLITRAMVGILGVPALLVVGAHVMAGILLGLMFRLGVLPDPSQPGFSLTQEPTPWLWFWRPLIGKGVSIALALPVTAYVGWHAEGWAMRRRIAPQTHEEVDLHAD